MQRFCPVRMHVLSWNLSSLSYFGVVLQHTAQTLNLQYYILKHNVFVYYRYYTNTSLTAHAFYCSRASTGVHEGVAGQLCLGNGTRPGPDLQEPAHCTTQGRHQGYLQTGFRIIITHGLCVLLRQPCMGQWHVALNGKTFILTFLIILCSLPMWHYNAASLGSTRWLPLSLYLVWLLSGLTTLTSWANSRCDVIMTEELS